MQTIDYNCPNCGHGLKIPIQYAGQRGGCKHCNAQFTVPVVGAPVALKPPPPMNLNKGTEYRSFMGGFWGCIGAASALIFVCCLALGGCIFLIGLGAQQSAHTVPASRTTQSPAETFSSSPPSKGGRGDVSSSETIVTLAEFNQLTNGMSYENVVKVIGHPGTVISENTILDLHTVMYSWENPGFLNGNMNAMFQNNALMSKAQLGLK